jgi:hypothetical protein
LAQLEAEKPIHPDAQLKMLKDVVEYEQSLLIRDEDTQRIQYYLTEVIKYNNLYRTK